MVKKMPLEYLVLFSELMEITKRITLNTVNAEQKRKLSEITDAVLKDITYILNYCSEQQYSLNEAKKLIILSKLKKHQDLLNAVIEQLEVTKVCSRCGQQYPVNHKYFYKDHRAKDGLRNDCKQCHKQTQKEIYNQKKACSEKDALVNEREPISEEYESITQE